VKDHGYLEFVLTTSFIFNFQTTCVYILFSYTADPPRITIHPKELKDVPLGRPVTFTVHATGTEPISYKWQWKPAGVGSEEWQLCVTEWSHNTTLKIPKVQESHEGSYQCVVSNCAGSQISNAAKLFIGKNPCFSQLYENISTILL